MKGQINRPDRYCLSYCPFQHKLRFCAFCKDPLLHFIFGKVNADVMEASSVYFLFSAASYPFIALYRCCAHLFFRAQENTKGPLIISVISECDEYCWQCDPDLGISYGCGRSCHCNPGFRIFCAVVVLRYKTKTAYCSQGLSEDPSGS